MVGRFGSALVYIVTFLNSLNQYFSDFNVQACHLEIMLTARLRLHRSGVRCDADVASPVIPLGIAIFFFSSPEHRHLIFGEKG